MRNLKTRRGTIWPDLNRLQGAVKQFGTDLGRLLTVIITNIAQDLATLENVDVVTALPTASSELRGRFFLVDGGAGVADVLHVCVKNAADAYVFKTVTIV